MRNYLSVAEDSKTIAGEVAQLGSSTGWSSSDEKNVALANDLEKHLSKFNIGYVDSQKGTWGLRRGGTRYFSTMSFLKGARSKIGSVLQKLQ